MKKIASLLTPFALFVVAGCVTDEGGVAPPPGKAPTPSSISQTGKNQRPKEFYDQLAVICENPKFDRAQSEKDFNRTVESVVNQVIPSDRPTVYARGKALLPRYLSLDKSEEMTRGYIAFCKSGDFSAGEKYLKNDRQYQAISAEKSSMFGQLIKGLTTVGEAEFWAERAASTSSGGGTSSGSQCIKGPACASADSRAQSIMNSMSMSPASINPAAENAYCANRAVVNVANICEREFRAAGNSYCADLSRQQASVSQSSASEALAAARASASSSSWTPSCPQ